MTTISPSRCRTTIYSAHVSSIPSPTLSLLASTTSSSDVPAISYANALVNSRTYLLQKVRVRLVPTFGTNVASLVDKSKHVCFDFDYDTVLLSLDDGEPDVDDPAHIVNALRAIGTHALNLLHAVETWSIYRWYCPLRSTPRLLPRLSRRRLTVSRRLPVSKNILLLLRWWLSVSTESATYATNPYTAFRPLIQPVPPILTPAA